MTLSINELKIIAVHFTNDSIQKKFLFKYMPELENDPLNKLKAETLETIAALTVSGLCCDNVNHYNTEVDILLHLEEKFPDY